MLICSCFPPKCFLPLSNIQQLNPQPNTWTWSYQSYQVAVTTTGTVLLSVSTWPSTTEFTALAAALLCRACQALMTVSLRIVFSKTLKTTRGLGWERVLEAEKQDFWGKNGGKDRFGWVENCFLVEGWLSERNFRKVWHLRRQKKWNKQRGRSFWCSDRFGGMAFQVDWNSWSWELCPGVAAWYWRVSP